MIRYVSFAVTGQIPKVHRLRTEAGTLDEAIGKRTFCGRVFRGELRPGDLVGENVMEDFPENGIGFCRSCRAALRHAL